MKSAAHSIVVRRPKRSDSRCFRHAQLLGEVGRQISQDDIEADGVENRAREGNSQGLRELDDLAKRGFLRVILVLKAGRLISVAANPQAIKSEREGDEEGDAPTPGDEGIVVEHAGEYGCDEEPSSRPDAVADGTIAAQIPRLCVVTFV